MYHDSLIENSLDSYVYITDEQPCQHIIEENFKFWGIKADLKQSDSVKVPPVKRGHQYEFAKPVPQEKTGAAEQGAATPAKSGAAVK